MTVDVEALGPQEVLRSLELDHELRKHAEQEKQSAEDERD